MTMTIRDAQTDDIKSLLPLVEDYYAASPVPHTVNHLKLAEHVATLVQPDNHWGGLLVAERNGELVGFAFLYYQFDKRQLIPIVDLNDLFVSANARRQGIARQLMQATFAWAKAHGAATVTWKTRTTNTKAQGLYDQVGQRESGWLHYSHEL